MLTRFKYLAKCCSDSDSIEILKALSQSPTRESKDRLFWYVEHDEDSIAKKKFGMREVKVSIQNDIKDVESLDKQPDPIYNVVGIFLINEDFLPLKPVESNSRSRSESARDPSANVKRTKKSTTRALNNRSMNSEHEGLRDKYHTLNKPQTQRIMQRSYIKGEVPLKDQRKSNLDRTSDLIKTDLNNTFTSPTRYQNSSRVKATNRLNQSAVRKVSLNTSKVNSSITKDRSDKQRLNTTTQLNQSTNYKEDSFLESRKKNKKKIDPLHDTSSPYTDEKKHRHSIKPKNTDLAQKDDAFNNVINSQVKKKTYDNSNPTINKSSTSRRREKPN